jgi:hypothetical protein
MQEIAFEAGLDVALTSLLNAARNARKNPQSWLASDAARYCKSAMR